MTASSFNPRLSGLRGAASLWVAIFHALASYGITLPLFTGWTGVSIFFALSANLLLSRLDASDNLRHYFQRRIVRIWPMYFGTCALVFLTVDHSARHLAANLGFVAIYIPNGAFATGTTWDATYVLWTLQIEEAAYLLLPLVARMNRTWRFRLGWGLIGVTATAALLPQAQGWYSLPPLWVGFYGIGILVNSGWRPPPLAIGAPIWAAGGLASTVLPWTWWVLLSLPATGWVLANPPAFLGSKPAVAAGETSYGLYLVHALWVQAAGALGLLGAEAMAWSMEGAARRKEIARRLGSNG